MTALQVGELAAPCGSGYSDAANYTPSVLLLGVSVRPTLHLHGLVTVAFWMVKAAALRRG